MRARGDVAEVVTPRSVSSVSSDHYCVRFRFDQSSTRDLKLTPLFSQIASKRSQFDCSVA